MYDKVLAAIDHSEVSERVLAAARDLALLSKGEVWVVHLREREVMPRLGLVPVESENDAEAAVKSAATVLASGGDPPRPPRAREIIEDAREHEADVIVMGSRGRGDLAGLVLGSTAHKVIHLADRPVLVVR